MECSLVTLDIYNRDTDSDCTSSCFSPTVAVMVAVPSPMAVTMPSGDTVATASSEDVHEASPAPSGRTVAVSCMVSPLLVKVAVAGDISTDCTSWVTVTSHVPLFPLTVAVTVAVPLLIPVTVPSDDTVAIASSDEVHVISPAVAFPVIFWLSAALFLHIPD